MGLARVGAEEVGEMMETGVVMETGVIASFETEIDLFGTLHSIFIVCSSYI